ncbi:putative peptide maturation dehydrogenase [Meiothermus sp. CFH 77666]|uniref:putative peptide maturation dehydrogenase n=1 Tax=Meiothermus sp. CFH 77666 TaxID=2817942 RepID=UPI001AA05200|nr:putative peptide maturation dehydrogenase [Meiothermus sp. CFH 77666]MBO1438405.1 putative peptide maturation dehydrogenase [Meiothermus sp. CFH 77666]
MKVKRSKYVAYYIAEGLNPDLEGLFRGEIHLRHESKVIAASALAEAETLLTLEEFCKLYSLSSYSWADVPLSEELIGWAKAGLLITELQEDWACAHRKREEILDQELWHCRSAVYHFLTKWKGVQLFPPVSLDEKDPYIFAVRRMAEGVEAWRKLEPPPPPFWSHPDALDSFPLARPSTNESSEFIATLLARCSTRYFDREAALQLGSISTLLYFGFAPQGTAKSVYTAVHKTSPSGGGLHPTEAYLLVRKVEGLQPGLYHYNSEHHSLEKLKSLSEEAAARKTIEYAAGQPYILNSGAVIILATRFYRNHWKYRRNDRTYLVMAMDIGHLGQTLYLLCTYLKLGGFFTAAVNASDIERDLGLDGAQQSVMALFAVGARHPEARPEFVPFAAQEV